MIQCSVDKLVLSLDELEKYLQQHLADQGTYISKAS
jgi:hypothetical protein